MPKKLITQYFNVQKNNDPIESPPSENQNIIESVAFYNECLEVEQANCLNVTCLKSKKELRQSICEMEKKCAKLEQAIITCKAVITEKNVYIENFDIKLHSTESRTNEPETAKMEIYKNDQLMYEDYKGTFDSAILSRLRSLGIKKPDDSTFVSVAVRSLYDGKLDLLKNKSLTGRSTKGEKREPITPDKLETLKKLFDERINSVTSDLKIRNERKKNLNTCIKNAIRNINDSVGKESVEEEVCSRLV